MSSQLFALAVVAAILGLLVLAMRAMWRQMRHVNAYTAARTREGAAVDPTPEEPGFEEYDETSGRYVGRQPEVNRGLIKQGARATRSGWYLDP
jgi:hypothetical protein